MFRWLRQKVPIPLKRRSPAPSPAPAAATYLTPGVYVEEIGALPPSISALATDIAVFIGVCERGTEAARISSLHDFETRYGGAPAVSVRVSITPDGTPDDPEWQSLPAYLLYHAVAHFFANGGQACHVVPAGNYGTLPSFADFEEALDRADEIADATLFAMPDALALSPADYAALASRLLDRCAARKNAFAILDLPGMPDAATVSDFRQRIGGALSFGAVYTPFVETVYPPPIDPAQIVVSWQDGARTDTTLGALTESDTALRESLTARLSDLRMVLPPSGAVMGAICRNDRMRGVWKAPANLPLASTSGPAVRISDLEQEALNVDPATGKSINAIRFFAGKGTLVWGARTLAGNDNEYRYVPVRRTLGTIEKSLENGLAPFVFEPNESRTWTRAGTTVENFLTALWRDGALQGAKPEHAFYVRVGIGETMTQQDIDNGRLIVEVGVAPLKPAEFVVIRIVLSIEAGRTGP